MTGRPTEAANLAAEVSAGLPRPRAGAVPIALIEVLVQALVQVLMVCHPTPVAGHAALVEPPYGLAGFRRRQWRKRISAAVAKAWNAHGGDPEALPDVQAAVMGRVRRGVGLTTLRRLYSESH